MNYPVVSIAAGAVLAYVMATFAGQLVARAHFPLPLGDRRIGCIDGLRGYLALSVLIHHFIIWIQVTRLGGGWAPPSVHLFEQLGAGGVALFFMTTGLVFYPRILGGFRACSWPAIYIKRLFRIVPLVAVSVMIITFVIALRTSRGLDSGFPSAFVKWITAKGEPPLLTYPDSGRLNAYVLWSLRYEWYFYIFVFPACALAMDLVRDRLPSWTVPTTLLVGALVARMLQASMPIWTYLPLFAVGMLAFECQRFEYISQFLRSFWAAIIAAASLGFGMLAFSEPYEFALPFFGFFFICVTCGNTMGGLLRTRGALVLGECSFGIYLLHGIVLSLLFVDMAPLTELLRNDWLPILLPFVAIAVTVTTSLTYLLIERPAIRVGNWLAKLRTNRPWSNRYFGTRGSAA